MTLIQPFL